MANHDEFDKELSALFFNLNLNATLKTLTETPPENAEPKKNDPSVSPLEKRDDARSLRWHAGVHAGLDIATLGRVGAMLGAIVVGLSMQGKEDGPARAMSEAGAAAFLSKSDDSQRMIETILQLTHAES